MTFFTHFLCVCPKRNLAVNASFLMPLTFTQRTAHLTHLITLHTTLLQVEVLRICAAMDEMMDESKEEGVTPGRANPSKSSR